VNAVTATLNRQLCGDRNDLFARDNLMVDFLRNVLNLNAFTPRYMLKTALDVMLQSTDLVKGITPEGGQHSLQEFHNKLQAFYLFEYIDSILEFPEGTVPNLIDMLHKTHSLGSFFSVWATEGVGHYYAYQLATSSPSVHGILSDAINVPVENLIPLHTGMGLALAEVSLNRHSAPETVADAFVQLCRRNSRHEYWPAAMEALGLVVRNLRPELIAPLDHLFSSGHDDLRAYFWHGIGRGHYFAVCNSLPRWDAPGQGFEMCFQAPHELGRLNALSGFAWAMTLVNLRYPEIIASWLDRYSAMITSDAVANGIFSALLVWAFSAPDDHLIRALGQHQPAIDKSILLRIWEKQVQQSTHLALKCRAVNAAPEIAKIFRYQPLAQFMEECKFTS
jgi:hypothetical protein